MSSRPLLTRARESTWDFLRLVDEKGREDKVFLLASGIAFNLLIAIIPLMLLVITGMAFFLERSREQSTSDLLVILNQFVPTGANTQEDLRSFLSSVLGSAPTAVTLGTVAFVWFSTRLFGSLRVVLADVFDIEETRSILKAKLFDMRIALASSLFIVAYVAITAYLTIATTGGTTELSVLEYNLGRLLAFVFIVLTFFLLYKYLPNKRVKTRTALVAALFTSVMFEIAKSIFSALALSMSAGSIYGGTIFAIVYTIVWVYYVALIFILGGEVAQVYDLRRARRMQRVVFE